MEPTIRRLVLANAIKYKGTANPKAIIGSVMKEHPEAKDDMPGTMRLINEITQEVNSLPLDEQHKQLKFLDPEHATKQAALKEERKKQANELPELRNAVMGKVATRMAPEPSKYAHLGHAMSFLYNYVYAKKYEGEVTLRFDDTNPEKSQEEFVNVMQKDIIDYLGLKPDSIICASDHMQTYYEYAEKFISEGRAYVCSCAQEDIKNNRRNMIACSHREQEVEETTALWSKMKEGSVPEGTQVLRLKIAMDHKNAVMRDPVLYRSCYTNHYKQGDKYKVWPMYDFESAVEEGLNNITHVFRGNEFDSRIELQHYVMDLLGLPKPEFIQYGRFTVADATAQGREIRALIESGEYLGWDDPRLITLRALQRRGIVKESFYELVKKVGFSKTQTTLDYSVIAAINRNLLDKTAKRLFAVKDPVLVSVTNKPESLTTANLAFHPDGKKGDRVLSVTNEFYIEKADNEKVAVGDTIRFMDCMNVKKVDGLTFEFVSESYEEFCSLPQKGALIHFVPKNGKEVQGEILLPDISTQNIVIEENITDLNEGEVVQFERYAFCRLDKKGEKPVFWFTHE